MIPLKAFDLAKIKKASSEAPRFVACGQSQQPLGDDLVLIIEKSLIAITNLTDPKVTHAKRILISLPFISRLAMALR